MLKEAVLLADHNYRVTIINSSYSKQLSDEDARLLSGYPIKLISAIRLQDKYASSVVVRLMYKIGRILVKEFNIQTPLALGYASWKYKNIAIKQKADLYMAHQEMGLYCGVQLLKIKKKVAFDFEDWYSEDLLSDARSYRPLRLLRQLEKYGLKNGVFCITTSHVMAREMAGTYNVPVPVCIYNVFNKKTEILNRTKEFKKPLQLFWFSQTTGPGRGLEQFFDLLNDLNVDLEVNLLGNLVNAHYKNQLQNLSVHPLNFYPLVESVQLPKLISQFDIGLALELKEPLSRSLTVTNKLFQYMLSGLPVIATNTQGQSEIIKNYGGGILIDYDDPERSKTQIQELLTGEQTLQVYRQQAVTAANELCWDKQKVILLDLVSAALNG
ncbi:glycosyltransferase [Mucilaginibacter ximonensis]|uniref:Glycosyltransferase n=1 Tax=Mucilaginibacter ximonensis TaxID=538021 RepID=A0ABW5YDS8_9SPHI